MFADLIFRGTKTVSNKLRVRSESVRPGQMKNRRKLFKGISAKFKKKHFEKIETEPKSFPDPFKRNFRGTHI